MEDAHTIILDLDEGQNDSNTFLAVYDGHGGASMFYVTTGINMTFSGGSTVAKFAGQNVHKHLVAEEAYRQKQYQEALKRAFLGTDEDLLASAWTTTMFLYLPNSQLLAVRSCTRSFWLYGDCSVGNFRWRDLCRMLFKFYLLACVFFNLL